MADNENTSPAPQTDEEKAAAEKLAAEQAAQAEQTAADQKAADEKAAADKAEADAKAEADQKAQDEADAQAKADEEKAAAESSANSKTYKVALVSHFPDGVLHQGPVPGDRWGRAEERELELTDEELQGYQDDQYFTIDGKATDAAKRIEAERASPAPAQSVEDSVAQNLKAAADADAADKKARDEAEVASSRVPGTKKQELNAQRELNARLKDGAVDAPTTPAQPAEAAVTGAVGNPSEDSVNGAQTPATDGDSKVTEKVDGDTVVTPPTAAELQKKNNRDSLVAQAKEAGYEATDEDTKKTLAEKIVELRG